MPTTMELSWGDLRKRAGTVYEQLRVAFPTKLVINIYGVPNGGIPAAILLQGAAPQDTIHLTEHPSRADAFVDDIIDSGRTKEIYLKKYPDVPHFVALVDKPVEGIKDWVSMSWERMTNQTGPEDAVMRLLEFIGEDPKREGLLETPKRVINSYKELFSGYGKDPKDVMKTFQDGACDEMVLLKGIPFISYCEHHIIPFHGEADIAYIPNGKVLGVSKLVRVLEIYARRLQIQEKLTTQITQALDEHLNPKGSACVITATHLCMMARGVSKAGASMVTSSLTGVFRDKPEVRGEFLRLIGK